MLRRKKVNKLNSIIGVKSYIFFFMIFNFTGIVVSQEIDYGKISELEVGESITLKNDDRKDKLKYLGSILDDRGTTKFHIVTVFSTVQASRTVHGHSQVIFLGKDYQFLENYELGLPEELPKRIENNALVFEFNNSKGESIEFKFIVGEDIPKLLCVSPNDCY